MMLSPELVALKMAAVVAITAKSKPSSDNSTPTQAYEALATPETVVALLNQYQDLKRGLRVERTFTDAYQAEIRMLRAHIETAFAAPQNYKFLPIHPTAEMLRASVAITQPYIAREVYKSMIAAAPGPPLPSDPSSND